MTESSTSYSPLMGDNPEGDLESSPLQCFSNLFRKGFKFWLPFFAIAAVIGLSLLIVIHYIENPHKSTLNDSSTVLPQDSEDIHRLFSRKWPIPDLKDQLLTSVSSDNNSISRKDIIVSDQLLDNALKSAVKAQKRRIEQEQNMEANGFVLRLNSPAAKHQALFKRPLSPETKKLVTDGFSMDQASQFIVKELGLTKEEMKDIDLKSNSTQNVTMPCIASLDPATACNRQLEGYYRAVEGFCNNLKHPEWGAINQPYRRIIHPDYSDGISSPRVAIDGQPLPHPRKLSTVIHSDHYREDSKATLLVPALGQFLGHEISSIVLENGENRGNGGLSCCKGDVPAPEAHPECFPMPANNEIDTTVEGTKCTNFWRSSPFPSCEFGPRDQFSLNTAFIDASVIYGSTQKDFNKLRELDKQNSSRGHMATYAAEDGRRLLSVNVNLIGGCNIPQETQYGRFCFSSGDSRVNENMALTAVHLIWVRQHNRLADKLTALAPPNVEHDKVFMEVREIIIAQMQHIIFKEFVPLLLGPELTKLAGLKLLAEGYYEDYDDTVNPMISNVFATAAYRVGHTMIQGQVNLLDEDQNILETVPMHELLVDPFRLWQPGNFDAILRGYAFSPASAVNTYFSDEMTRRLFLDRHLFDGRNLFKNHNGTTPGLDLAALNIHRGRDHGIPGYTMWRKACGLKPIQNFTDLIGIWNEDTVYLTRDLYKTVDDIDMYSGMLAELHMPGAMVGPLVGCLLADQFLRLRQGDRFWYESKTRPRPFTPEQLQMIRKTSLARLICNNGDSIKKIQARVLERPSDSNPIINCTDNVNIPLLDLSLWTTNMN